MQLRSVPLKGDYLTVSWDSDWYMIGIVLHCDIKDNDREYDAEVYLHKVDHLTVIKSYKESIL